MSGCVRFCPLNLEKDGLSIHRNMNLFRGNPLIRVLLVLGITLLGFVLGAILLPPLGSDTNPRGSTAGSSEESK